jgi:predicted transcriptional regulator
MFEANNLGLNQMFIRGQLMKRSKLQLYLDTLSALSLGLWMKPTLIMYRVNEYYGFLMRDLDFLVKSDLIEKRVIGGHRATYRITQRGLSALSSYREIQRVFLATEGTSDSLNALLRT